MEPLLNYRRFRFTGVDGTSPLGWTNDADGPRSSCATVLAPRREAWLKLLSDEPDYWVAGWNHPRRPGFREARGPKRIGVPDHVDDAFALMDAMGWDSAVIVGWSIGVNWPSRWPPSTPSGSPGSWRWRACPAAPSRPASAPLMVPKPLRRHMAMGVVQGGRLLGAPLTALARAVPRAGPSPTSCAGAGS